MQTEGRVYSAQIPNTLVWDRRNEIFMLAFNENNTSNSTNLALKTALAAQRERARIGDMWRLGLLNEVVNTEMLASDI